MEKHVKMVEGRYQEHTDTRRTGFQIPRKTRNFSGFHYKITTKA